MYKINQLIIVFIFLSASSNAQVNKIDIGIHGGLGISNIYGHTNLFNPTKLNTPTVGISLCLATFYISHIERSTIWLLQTSCFLIFV